MRVCLQMDPLSSLDATVDTTLLLAQEALSRGWRVDYYEPHRLSLLSSPHKMLGNLGLGITALGRRLDYRQEVGGAESAHVWHQGPLERIDLTEADFLLIRQDPPFDMRYITATYFLDLLPSSVSIQSPTEVLRGWPEKIIPFYLPSRRGSDTQPADGDPVVTPGQAIPRWMPPTLITQTLSEAIGFIEDGGPCVLKPLYLFGGRGIKKITSPGDLLSLTTDDGIEILPKEDSLRWFPDGLPLILQTYIPSIDHEGDKRIIVLGGEVVGWFRRRTRPNEFRTNLHQGGVAEACDLTGAEKSLGQEVAQVLMEKGVLLAGLDVAAEKLLEVNITCPSGLATLHNIGGPNLAPVYWDAMVSWRLHQGA